MRATAGTERGRAAPVSFQAGCAGRQLTCARPGSRVRSGAPWDGDHSHHGEANLASAGGESGGNNCLGADTMAPTPVATFPNSSAANPNHRCDHGGGHLGIVNRWDWDNEVAAMTSSSINTYRRHH